MPLSELKYLYQQCFPEKRAEEEIKALGDNFKFDILDSSFIIYNVLSPDEAEIIDIGTAPEKRRSGGARNLLEKTISSLSEQNIRTIYLDVAENNVAAIQLYNSCGFEKYNSRKDYYNSANGRINAILMKKSI